MDDPNDPPRPASNVPRLEEAEPASFAAGAHAGVLRSHTAGIGAVPPGAKPPQPDQRRDIARAEHLLGVIARQISEIMIQLDEVAIIADGDYQETLSLLTSLHRDLQTALRSGSQAALTRALGRATREIINVGHEQVEEMDDDVAEAMWEDRRAAKAYATPALGTQAEEGDAAHYRDAEAELYDAPLTHWHSLEALAPQTREALREPIEAMQRTMAQLDAPELALNAAGSSGGTVGAALSALVQSQAQAALPARGQRVLAERIGGADRIEQERRALQREGVLEPDVIDEIVAGLHPNLSRYGLSQEEEEEIVEQMLQLQVAMVAGEEAIRQQLIQRQLAMVMEELEHQREQQQAQASSRANAASARSDAAPPQNAVYETLYLGPLRAGPAISVSTMGRS